MTIKPCSHCLLKKTCSKRAELVKSVRGLGLTSIKFRCDILAGNYPAGMWCEATFDYVYDDSTGRTDQGIIRACVVRLRSTDGKIVVWVPGTETMWLESIKGVRESGEHPKVEWVAVWPDRLRPIPDEPNEPHCADCGSPAAAASPNAACTSCSPREDAGYY